MPQTQTESDGSSASTAESLKSLYRKDIKDYKLLDKSKENLTLKEISKGDLAAREFFLKANLKLVLSVANQFFSCHVSDMDLIQEGNVGLIHAVDSFKADSGCRFSTFAVILIRQQILKFILENSNDIYIPKTAGLLKQKVNRCIWQIKAQSGRTATNQEISEITGINLKTVSQVRSIKVEMLSLDTPVGDNGECNLEEIIPDRANVSPEDIAERRCIQNNIFNELCKLKPRERQILQMRFGLNNTVPRSLEEIAKQFHVSTERIRQIENISLEKLRKSPYIRGLHESLYNQ